MEELINKTLLRDKVVFNGSIEELKNKLNDSDDRNYGLEWISNNEFKFLSTWSLGTMIAYSNPDKVDGIKGYGLIMDSNEDNRIEIQLSTKLRIEMYFMLGISLFFIVLSFFIDFNISNWMYLVFPISIFWLWGVYRIQEKLLFKRVKQHLGN